MKHKIKDYVQAVGIVVATPFVGPTPSQQIMQSFGKSYALTLRAALGVKETQQEWIARVEHELMIAGHEIDCLSCRRQAYLQTPQGRAEAFAEWWFG